MQNPLLKGVNFDKIPAPHEPWLGPYPDTVLKFNEFRNNSICILSNQPKLNSAEQALSLNGIIHSRNENGRQYGFNVALWEQICFTAGSTANYHFIEEKILDSDLLIVKGIVESFILHCKTRLLSINQYTRDLSSQYINSSRSPSLMNTCKMLLNLSERINYDWNPSSMSEDSFTINVFDPVYDAFFRGVENTVNHGADYYLQESIFRKKQLALLFNEPITAVAGRKPDRSLQWRVNSRKHHHIYLVEIKTENTAKGRQDLVKIGTMFKDCLDNMLNNGLKRKKCFIVGMLQGGRRCASYCFYLLSNYFHVVQGADACFMPSSDLD